MKKIFALLLGCSLFYACDSKKTTEDSNNTTAPSEATTSISSEEEMKNYLILPKWATTKRADVISILPTQHQQLVDLYKKGLVENVYFDKSGHFPEGENVSMIAFVLKAANENAAKSILDTLVLAKRDFVEFTLRPLGVSWFGRSDSTAVAKAMNQHVYCVFFALDKTKTLDKATLTAQATFADKLRADGTIENGYFDTEQLSGKTSEEGAQPALYFINAKSEKEARKILDQMPLVKSKNIQYGLKYVGQFLMGKVE